MKIKGLFLAFVMFATVLGCMDMITYARHTWSSVDHAYISSKNWLDKNIHWS